MIRTEKKQKINVAFLGHVDCGKSTVLGHLFHLAGIVSSQKMTEYESKATKLGRGSFKYSYVFDKSLAERERGITIDFHIQQLEIQKRLLTVFDSPGHRDFIKTLLFGLSFADSAVLVVDASIGGFEVGVSRNGSTREHALLAFTLGVKNLIVVVNKMDDSSVAFSQKRFNEIKEEVQKILRRVGYNAANVPFIPVSGWVGTNLVKKTAGVMDWYEGPTLLEALNELAVKRPAVTGSGSAPLRLPIAKVYRIRGIGTVAVGCVLSGQVANNDIVSIGPNKLQARVSSLESFRVRQEEANVGDFVGLHLQNTPLKDVRRGMVISHNNATESKARKVLSFKAKIILLPSIQQIAPGYKPMLAVHTAYVPCLFEEFISKNDARTGKLIEESPAFIKRGESGRLIFRDNWRTVAVGVVQSVEFETE